MLGSEGDAGHVRSAELSELRERVLVMVAAFEREESSQTWAKLRELAERSTRLTDLRGLVRECRGIMGALTPAGRRALDIELRERFGADPQWERTLGIVAKVRARGRIRSESEYRSVQAYQDSISSNADSQEEFLVLGGLLDSFSAAR
jgi:hypothetical protein